MSKLESARAALGALVLSSVASVALAGAEPGGPGDPDRGVAPPASAPWRVERSLRVARGTWFLADPADGAGGAGAIVIEGAQGLVLDLGDAELRGASGADEPDALAGTAIVVRRSRDVVVRGGDLAGYRFGVRVEDSSNVRLEGVRVHDVGAPRLWSSAAVESASDALQRSDPALWERTGAAFVVLRSSGVGLERCAARRGAVGIASVDSPGLAVEGGELAYLSAFGVALWRSPDARLAGLAVDAAVRGGASAFWRGGHGSAGVLAVDSPSLEVRDCAVTRCGTGLAALGASAGLRLVRDDFSGALQHGVELVRVEDAILAELVVRGAGLRGVRVEDGSRVKVVECVIERAGGAAIEVVRGTGVALARNWLARSTAGLVASEASGLGLASNGFESNGLDWEVERCVGLAASQNVFGDDLTLHVAGVGGDGAAERDAVRGVGGALPSGRLEGTSVVAFDPARLAELEEALAALGRTVGRSDAVSRPAAELAAAELDPWGPWDPSGARPRPSPRPDGGLLADARWDARWFSWADGPDPRGVAAARAGWRELANAPLERRTVAAWRTPFGAGARPETLPAERIGLLSRAEVFLEAGRYRLHVTSDDGVALRVDGRTLVENWTWHAASVDRADFEVSAGAHLFELEYFQIDGPSALALELDRVQP